LRSIVIVRSVLCKFLPQLYALFSLLLAISFAFSLSGALGTHDFFSLRFLIAAITH